MDWQLRTLIIIPLSLVDAANQLAAQLTGSEADALTFGRVLLSADGNAPATHTACSTLLKMEHTTVTGAFFAQHSDARWWSWSNTANGTGEIVAAWDGQPRDAGFSVADTLAEVGLQRIEQIEL